VTLSNVAVQITPLTWLEIARPTWTVDGIVNVLLPTCVQVVRQQIGATV
jgi:hypothetical protein